MKTHRGQLPALALAAVISAPICASADPSHYSYAVEGGEVIIYSYKGPGGEVAIPSELDGYPVTTIADWAFYNKTAVTGVTIPDSVTTIGSNSFAYCTGMSVITIGSGVATIGTSAFGDCGSLTGIEVDSGNDFYSSLDGVLFDKNQHTLLQFPAGGPVTYTVPDGVTAIADHAFSGCASLTSVTLAESVVTIGSYAFAQCHLLASMTIPDTTTTIGDGAFYYCNRLASVSIGQGVTTIVGSRVFLNCNALAEISVDPANASFSSLDGVLFDKNQTMLLQCPPAKTGSFTIPSTVILIGPSAFRASRLSSIAIPPGVTAIGDHAFYYCTQLGSVIIPEGVTAIEEGTFGYCSSMTSISIPDSVATIGASAFLYCPALTSVIIPEGVTAIANSTFKWCTSLASVTIPDSVETIGDSAFDNCIALASVKIPPNVTSIGYQAFYNCISLTRVIIPSSVGAIGHFAFDRCTALASIYFRGSPPVPGSTVFNTPSMLYYLPAHAAQWADYPTYSGRPTALWNPAFTALKFEAGVFSTTVTGTPEIPIAVEACTDLSTGGWIRLHTTNLPLAGTMEFTDPDAAGHPSRFYRIVGP